MKGFKDKSSRCRLEAGVYFYLSIYFFRPPCLITLAESISLFVKVCDVCFSSDLGRRPSCLLPARGRSFAGSVTEYCPWTCQECSVLL